MQITRIDVGSALDRVAGTEETVGVDNVVRFGGARHHEWIEVRVGPNGGIEITSEVPLVISPVVSNCIIVDQIDKL